MAEKFTNNAQTTLNGAINNSTTTVVVTSAASLPATGVFRIRVDDEIMIVSAVSTNTLTVARGQEGTSAASHADLATVRHVLTAGALGELRASGSGSFPSSPASGDRYLRTDRNIEYFYDGTRWLSLNQYTMVLSRAGDATEPSTATKNAMYYEPLLETIYIEQLFVGFYIVNGTALSASHKWVATLTVWDSAGAQGAAISTITVDSGSLNVFRASSASGINTATLVTDTILSVNITKTGNPGTFYIKPRVVYRLIG